MSTNKTKRRFISLCSAFMMLIQICSVQVFASAVVPGASSVNETDSVLNIDLSKIDVDNTTTLVAFYTNDDEADEPTVPADVVIFEQEDPLQSSYSFTPIAEPKDYMIVIFEGRNGQQIKDVITLTHVTHYYAGWSGDETEHWKECNNASCNNRIDVAEHSDITQNPTDCTASPVCGVCGLDAGVAYESHLYTDSFDTSCNRDGCLGVRTASAVEITLDTNGGNSLTQSTVTTGSNGKLRADLPQPTRNGWSFNGWYTAATGGTKINRATTVFYDDATIYAQWTSVYQHGGSTGGGGAVVKPITYTLHFETNGGTGVNDFSRQKDVEVNLDGFTPSKEGFNFMGWYTDADFENAVNKIVLTKDVTVYAKWESVEDKADDSDENTSKSFSDVNETDWFYEAISFVQENGIMNGVDEQNFAPYNTTTRGMIATMLYRLEGEPALTGNDEPFADVASGAYYESAAVWAKESGIISGYETGLFGADDNVSREQLATILYRYAEYKEFDTNYEDTNIASYDDALEISEYAYPALQWACKNGILNGDENRLMPGANAQRCQVAAIFARFIGHFEGNE